MWGHLPMGAPQHLSEATTNVVLSNHCWRWPISQEDWESRPGQRDGYNPRLRAECTQRKQGYGTLRNVIHTFKIIYMYICSTNRIYIYIYIKISTEHLKFGYNLDPKNDFFFFLVAVLHGMWDLISLDQGWNSHPLHWKHRDLTIGLEVPRKIFELQKVAVIQICILRP